jgi:hypothetical protein
VLDVFVCPTAKATASVNNLSSNLPVIKVLLPDFYPTQSYFGLVSVISCEPLWLLRVTSSSILARVQNANFCYNK